MIWLGLKGGRGDLEPPIWNTHGLRRTADGLWEAGSTRNRSGCWERTNQHTCTEDLQQESTICKSRVGWRARGMVTAWMHTGNWWPRPGDTGLCLPCQGVWTLFSRVLDTSKILSCEGHGQICFLERFLWHLEGRWSSKRWEQKYI